MRAFKTGIIERLMTRTKSFAILEKTLKKVEILPHSEVNELVTYYQKTGCPKAKDKVVKSILKFMVSVAKSYTNIKGAETTDLLSVGYEGVEKALSKYDAKKGFAFYSYAVWWIRQSIIYYLQKQDLIQSPYTIVRPNYKGVKEFVNKFTEEHGVKPTNYEICQATEATPYILRGMEVFKIKSTSDKVGNDPDGLSVIDTIADSRYLPNARLEEADKYSELHGALALLNPKERFMIEKYYGIGCNRMTLEEIGNEIGYTRERVRQINMRNYKRLAIMLK